MNVSENSSVGPPPNAETARERSVAWASGVYFLACLTVGAVLALPSLKLGPDVSRTTLLRGTWAKDTEQSLDRSLVLRNWGVTAWGAFDYLVFREARPGALVGRNGWLYTTEEFSRARDETRQMDRNATFVAKVARQLSARDASLLVVVVPAKARLARDHLGRYALPSSVSRRAERFTARLSDVGVNALDLSGPLIAAQRTASVFLRTDTHWSPFGARAAARAVAGYVTRLTSKLPRSDFTVRTLNRVPYAGDLTRFVPLGPWRERLGPRPDDVPTVRLERLGESSLLGEEDVPVVLVGTSYSAASRWGFAAWLAEALRADVLNAAEEGVGPAIPMARYLSGPDFADTPPKLVIWEIPERFVAQDFAEAVASDVAARHP
ncbi:alginate O-acetyltransferase AlgX-related protein [Deinococcus yavapaiensis]|uniref:Alginate O-acetyltransferase complex protein AlgJ n=1 Tax=Deinococcus yavapaiensis KR-236 TaxID=694435 RepID=A0A318S6Z9_9DEIO|nr:alginate O-acetyltransferase [Deinococcus yavapaiensis]PYE52819.1 alginate O-acetyltransferase complex protein AlgJ [Deinococcus yavapaiensis KR-236]